MVKVEEHTESTGPDMWEVAAYAKPGEQDWEYLARKNANEGKGDAVFTQLQYAPACPHMPVCKGRCEQPVFAWLKKKTGGH